MPGTAIDTAQRRDTYRLFRLNGQPIFAVPTKPRRLRLAGIARYQPISPKRAAYRRLIRLLMQLGADGLVSRAVADPVDRVGDPTRNFDLESWLKHVRKDLDKAATCAVFWPPQRERGRVYVHIFGSDLRPIGFAKVSFDEENDIRLDREEQMLRDLAGDGLRTFRVPHVLSAWRDKATGHASLVMEAIPESARPLPNAEDSYPAACVAEFAREPRRMSAADLQQTSWWAAFESNLGLDHPAFTAHIRTHLEAQEGAKVCRTHGDFGRANIVLHGETPWIFDWEESHPDGPVMSDDVSFYLDVNKPRSSSDSATVIAGLRDRFSTDADPVRRVAVMLALAFRSTVAPRSAGGLISHWNQL